MISADDGMIRGVFLNDWGLGESLFGYPFGISWVILGGHDLQTDGRHRKITCIGQVCLRASLRDSLGGIGLAWWALAFAECQS